METKAEDKEQHCGHCDGALIWTGNGYRHVNVTHCLAFGGGEVVFTRVPGIADPSLSAEEKIPLAWIDLNGCDAGMHCFRRDGNGILQCVHGDDSPCERAEYNFSGMLLMIDQQSFDRR
jgi:hypothetical protein